MTSQPTDKPTQAKKKKKGDDADKTTNAAPHAPVTPVNTNPAPNGHQNGTNEPQKRERGRPAFYSEEFKKQIAERVKNGETPADIFREPGMPSLSMWTYWCQKDPELKELDDLSKPVRARTYFERGLSVIDNLDDDDVQRAKVAQVKQRAYFQAASLLDPVQYSDKAHAVLGKAGAGTGVAIQINIGSDGVSVSTGDGE